MNKVVNRKKKGRKLKYQDEFAELANEEDDIRYQNKIAEAIEHRNTSDILKEMGDPESPKTIGFYFANIVCFIFVMLIYYGLVIIIFIAGCIQLYDFNYNYDEFIAQFSTKKHHHVEFKDQAEVK